VNEPPIASGYAHERYVQSLAEFGTPLPLPRSGGWLLERPIPDTIDDRDAMGPYPLFTCRDWSGLGDDLAALSEKLVSVTVVTDPFGNYDQELLRAAFRDLTIPFKQHYVVDLERDSGTFVTRHHRYYARKARAQMTVEVVSDPAELIDEWMRLYGFLIERHAVSGVQAFSRRAFEIQLRVPGVVALRATREGEVLGAHLWYIQGDVAYSHLVGVSPEGYVSSATYALYAAALEQFATRVRWLDLGAGAGAATGEGSGLTQFKKGWANGVRTVYLCGRILQPERYTRLSSTAPETRYFPAYRAGELT
jgi:hypothetical protein